VRVAALIVTHNRRQTLAATLPRVLAEAVDRVMVVDNSSTDDTGPWLAAQDDPRVEVLRLAENTGGAGGFAAGLAALMAGPQAPDWTVLFDDDAWPCPGAIAAFREGAAGADPGAGPGGLGAIAAAVIYPDGRASEMNRPALNPFWHPGVFLRTLFGGGRGGFHLADAELAAGAAPREVDTASFVGFFVSRGARARAGLPEAGLFIYGDDLLYCLKLRRAGFRILSLPAVRFVHDCATLGAGFHYRPLWKIYYHCRNGVSVARAAAGPVVFPFALAWYLVVWWRRSRHCPADLRPLYRQLMWRGVRDGLMGRRGRISDVHSIAALAPTPPTG
jgi:GT2 family glycosyltransferase